MKKYTQPKLYTANFNLSKQWYIYYNKWCNKSKKYIRKRYSQGLNTENYLKDRINTAYEILDRAKENIDYLDSSLENKHTNTVIDNFLKAIEKKACYVRKTTIRDYYCFFNIFKKWLYDNGQKHLKINDLTFNDISLFLIEIKKQRNLSNKSYNNYLILIRSILNELLREKIINTNPSKGIKKLPCSLGKNIAYSRHQQNEIISYLKQNDPYTLFYIKLIYYCFIRPSELRQIKIKYLDVDSITIPSLISKNRKHSVIKIPCHLRSDIEKIINQYPSNYFLFSKDRKPGETQIGYNYFSKRYRCYLNTLGYSQEYTLYSWKHTGVIRAFKSGIDIKDLQIHLRHSSLDMVNNYLKSLGLYSSDKISNSFPVI